MKIQSKGRKISVTKYISVVDESIKKLIHLFLGLENEYYGRYMGIDITMDISKRLHSFPEYKIGLQFLQYLSDDIEPLEVYILILQKIDIRSKIIPTVSIYSERLDSTIEVFKEMNTPEKRMISKILNEIV